MIQLLFKLKLFCVVALFLVSCSHQQNETGKQENLQSQNNFENLSKGASTHNILVCAHRGDWRNAPENSIQSIKLALQMGVDIVEIDVRTTKDDILILMHDETIGRTTSGQGIVSDLNWDDLKKLNLKNAIGSWTKHKIPTLEEVLLFSKDKVDLNIDLKDKSQWPNVLQLVETFGMFDQVLFKLNGIVSESKAIFGSHLEHMRFMPIVDLGNENALEIVQEYLESNIKLEAFEILVKEESEEFQEAKKMIKSKGIKLWINALWDDMCANHSDDRAIDDIEVYQWYIDHEIDMIQTDRPQLLIDYLKDHELHD